MIKKLLTPLAIVWVSVFIFLYTNKDMLKVDDDIVDLDDMSIVTDIKNINNSISDEEINIDIKLDSDKILSKDELKILESNWDMYLLANQPRYAIVEYKKYLNSKNNLKINKKIAWAFFMIKEYGEVVKYYNKITYDELSDNDITKYIYSLIYTTKYNRSKEVADLIDKINTFDIDSNDKFYYINTISCTRDFHQCKKDFDAYFKKNKELSPRLINIKNAIQTYEDLKAWELYYKDTLITKEIYNSWLYTISNKLWIDILKERKWYLPILQIVWKWYYFLWELDNSLKYLTEYYKKDTSNIDVTYTLWDIYFSKKDYKTSNIYLNSALSKWYEPIANIQRKLIYNYYKLWDARTMLNIFSFLLNQNSSNISDYSLGIYQAITTNNTDDARSWIERWLDKFNKTSWYEIFYGYLGSIDIKEWDLTWAKKELDRWYRINPDNPLINLNLWIYHSKKWEYKKAKIYLIKAINTNKEWDFWKEAQVELDKIAQYL